LLFWTITKMRRLRAPIGRHSAKAVLYLATDDSSFVTGIELFVDGGGAQV
jgi:hypothetical protein